MTDYYLIDDSLQADGLPYTPAELHGQLMGRFVFGVATFSFEQWLTELAQDGELNTDLKEGQSAPLLAQLCAQVMQSMREKTDDLHPFLPEEPVDLRDRLEALANWANGFLLGLGLGGLRAEDLDDDLKEGLNDLRAISLVDIDTEVNEAAEKQLFELTEYVRMVLLHLLEVDRVRAVWERPSQSQLH
jgi:uncharacterized protein YgfB (UPF0149 family)